jgi:hypothetical protein
MTEFGINKNGFNIKPFKTILAKKFELAREMFGSDADLRPNSALRKLLEISSFEDHELWKGMEQLYYSNFISTASGDTLDLLGEDVGVRRRFIIASGIVKFELSDEEPGRIYHLPIGTIVETDIPVQHFRTLELVSLSEQNKEMQVEIAAFNRGSQGNVPTSAINKINPTYAQRHLNLGNATVVVENEESTDGGEKKEEDASYRDLILGHPRTLWTLEAVRQVVKSIDGVRDCRIHDPAGGTDVSLSKFGLFLFSQRRFGGERLLGTPYFFDILVAPRSGFLFESEGDVIGLKEKIDVAVREVRPPSIFYNILRANDVLIGIRTKIVIQSGHDQNAVITAIKDKLQRRINTLGLSNSVLYSEVLCDCMAVTGVIDVQQLHLRRCPPLFGRINFSGSQHFQSEVVEVAVGENIDLHPDEIAEFRVDSDLINIEVDDR